jgi:hypothetical protein
MIPFITLARSPVYSYLSSSLQGVPIIRAYGAAESCVREFAQYLDNHSRVYSVMLALNRWSGMHIECVVAGFVGFLAFSILLLHRSTDDRCSIHIDITRLI